MLAPKEGRVAHEGRYQAEHQRARRLPQGHPQFFFRGGFRPPSNVCSSRDSAATANPSPFPRVSLVEYASREEEFLIRS